MSDADHDAHVNVPKLVTASNHSHPGPSHAVPPAEPATPPAATPPPMESVPPAEEPPVVSTPPGGVPPVVSVPPVDVPPVVAPPVTETTDGSPPEPPSTSAPPDCTDSPELPPEAAPATPATAVPPRSGGSTMVDVSGAPACPMPTGAPDDATVVLPQARISAGKEIINAWRSMVHMHQYVTRTLLRATCPPRKQRNQRKHWRRPPFFAGKFPTQVPSPGDHGTRAARRLEADARRRLLRSGTWCVRGVRP